MFHKDILKIKNLTKILDYEKFGKQVRGIRN